jgi:flagellar motor switch protein FliN
MSQDVQLEQLIQAHPPAAAGALSAGGDLRRLSAVPVDLSVEIGRTRMTVGETLELREGSVITLDRMAGEPVDLLVNGTPIARGEVVVIDEQFGLRLTEVLTEPSEPTAQEAEAEAAMALPPATNPLPG